MIFSQVRNDEETDFLHILIVELMFIEYRLFHIIIFLMELKHIENSDTFLLNTVGTIETYRKFRYQN